MDQKFFPPSKINFSTVSNDYIQQVFKMLFDPQDKITHKDLFSTFKFVRQEQKIIEQILKRSDTFDWMCLFSFLKKEYVMEGYKVLLEQIIFKCLRVNPIKIFKVICREDISELLWKHSLHHSIFRIIYVVALAQWQHGTIEYLEQKQIQLLHSMLTDLCRLPQLVFQAEKTAILCDNGDQTLKFRVSSNIEHMLLQFMNLMKILPPSSTSQMIQVLGIQLLTSNFKEGLEKLQQLNIKQKKNQITQQQQIIDYYEQFLEGIAGILINLLKIIFDESILETLQCLRNSKDHTQIRKKAFQEILQLQSLINTYLISPVYTKITISNGQTIPDLGLLRYKLIQLQVVVLDKLSRFTLKQEIPDHGLVLSGKIGTQQIQISVPQFDPFNIVKIYLTLNRWNNILQLELIKLVDKSLTAQNYYTFFKRIYIQKFVTAKKGSPQLSNCQQSFSDTFLGTLVTQFRNRDFIFLSSLRYTSAGNRQTIYKISQLILLNCQKEDKTLLISQYPHFKTFIEDDLEKYSNYLFQNAESYFAGALAESQNHVLQSIKEVVESDRKSNLSLLAIVSPPQQIRKSNIQIHEHLQSHCKIKQDSIQPINKKRRKNSLTEVSFIKKLQGLVFDKSLAHSSIC